MLNNRFWKNMDIQIDNSPVSARAILWTKNPRMLVATRDSPSRPKEPPGASDCRPPRTSTMPMSKCTLWVSFTYGAAGTTVPLPMPTRGWRRRRRRWSSEGRYDVAYRASASCIDKRLVIMVRRLRLEGTNRVL